MNRVKIGTIALMGFLTICGGAALDSGASALAKRSGVDLTGDWRVTSPSFHSIIPIEKGCHSGPLPGTNAPATAVSQLKIIQKLNGNVVIPPFRQWVNIKQKRHGIFGIQNPTVAGNVLTWTESGGGFTSKFKGTISPDGNKIVGKVVCQHISGKPTAVGPFTLVRLTKPKPPTILGNG